LRNLRSELAHGRLGDAENHRAEFTGRLTDRVGALRAARRDRQTELKHLVRAACIPRGNDDLCHLRGSLAGQPHPDLAQIQREGSCCNPAQDEILSLACKHGRLDRDPFRRRNPREDFTVILAVETVKECISRQWSQFRAAFQRLQNEGWNFICQVRGQDRFGYRVRVEQQAARRKVHHRRHQREQQ
jgi:hypothetical protein